MPDCSKFGGYLKYFIESNRRRALIASTLVPAALLLNGWYDRLLSKEPIFLWFSDIFGFLFLPTAVFLWLYVKAGINPHNYGLVTSELAGGLGEVLKETMMALAVLWPIARFMPELAWPFLWRFGLGDYAFLTHVSLPLPHNTFASAFAIAFMFLSAAVVEELYFRGLLKHLILGRNRARNGVNVWIYVSFSALLFGACHWERGAAHVLAMSVFGTAACVMYLKFSSIYPLIVAHAFIGAFAKASRLFS